MKRIAIVGSGGAGKSTLAQQIGAVLGIAPVHLDALFWRPGWVETPREEWHATVRELVSGDTWILDGNYGGTLDIRLAAADTVIFLDLSRSVCLWRAVKRQFRFRGRTRPDMAPGCPERLDREFLTWIWKYPTHSRPRVLQAVEQHAAGKHVIRLRSRAELARFLADLRTGSIASRPSGDDVPAEGNTQGR